MAHNVPSNDYVDMWGSGLETLHPGGGVNVGRLGSLRTLDTTRHPESLDADLDAG